jgi:bifunctional oligoribonuclease and PAP phosphatase NrnA
VASTLAAEIREKLNQANRIVVFTHIQPDGDAIGSLTAMGQALRQMGKEPTLVCNDGVPGLFRFLPMSDSVQAAADQHRPYDLIVALDCGDESRIGSSYALLAERELPVINIDHHITNTYFGLINLVEVKANSTTELLYQLFPKWGVHLTAELATSLLTGLVTDTLGFRTAGVNGDTLRVASALVDAGADLFTVTSNALNLKPLSTLLLWQKGLGNMRLDEGLLWTSITHRECREAGHAAASSAGLVNILSEVHQVAMSAVLIELEDGRVSVGFRCRPPYSVSELALNLGGGGHPLAAGCTVDGPLSKAESLVVGMSKDEIRRQRRRDEG